MDLDKYNYNNEKTLQLRKDEVIKNREVIKEIYKDYEILISNVIYKESLPYLELNDTIIAEIENPEVLKESTHLYIDEDFLNEYGELVVRCKTW